MSTTYYLPVNALVEIASFLPAHVIPKFTATMPAWTDMQNLSAKKLALMHEDRNVTQSGYADFQFAEAEGWHDVLTKLIFNKNVDPQELFYWALRRGRTVTSIVRVIFDHLTKLQIDPTANCNYAMKWASELGHAEIVKILLAWEGEGPQLEGMRVNPASNMNFAIKWASKNGHTGVIEALLEWTGTGPLVGQRVDPTSNNQNHAFREASENGQTEVVKLLLAWKGKGNLEGKRVDPTRGFILRDSNYPLLIASEKGYTEIVKLLLAWKGEGDLEGVRVDSIADVKLALQLAKENGKNDIVEILFEWIKLFFL